MILDAKIKESVQPSPEAWSGIVRSHTGYHKDTLRQRGVLFVDEAIERLSCSPVSDHVLDAGWIALEAAVELGSKKRDAYFNLTESNWKTVKESSSSVIDKLQAEHFLAFLPIYRQVAARKRIDLLRLDTRLQILNRRIVLLADGQDPTELPLDSREYNGLKGASAEIAISSLVNRHRISRGERFIEVWPTNTRDDRSRSHSQNKDLNIGIFPEAHLQIQVKFGQTDVSDYEADDTPVISLRSCFEEINPPGQELYLCRTLAETDVDDPRSIALSTKAAKIITELARKKAA